MEERRSMEECPNPLLRGHAGPVAIVGRGRAAEAGGADRPVRSDIDGLRDHPKPVSELPEETHWTVKQFAEIIERTPRHVRNLCARMDDPERDTGAIPGVFLSPRKSRPGRSGGYQRK